MGFVEESGKQDLSAVFPQARMGPLEGEDGLLDGGLARFTAGPLGEHRHLDACIPIRGGSAMPRLTSVELCMGATPAGPFVTPMRVRTSNLTASRRLA